MLVIEKLYGEHQLQFSFVPRLVPVDFMRLSDGLDHYREKNKEIVVRYFSVRTKVNYLTARA